jgi:hypothetical protein
MVMKSRTLLAQVLSVNLLLIAGTFLVALVALDERNAFRGREMLVLGSRWSRRCSATGCCCAAASSRSTG